MKPTWRIALICIVLTPLFVFTWCRVNESRRADYYGAPEEEFDNRSLKEAGYTTLEEVIDQYGDGVELSDEERSLRPKEVPLTRWLFGKAIHIEKERKRNGEVLFYGKVVDSEDRPLAGVTVSATALQYPLTYIEFIQQDGNSRNIPIEVVTDADGRFEISGIRAMSIGFSNRSKEGYEIDGRIMPMGLDLTFQDSYPYRYKADFDNPVIFRMKKVE